MQEFLELLEPSGKELKLGFRVSDRAKDVWESREP